MATQLIKHLKNCADNDVIYKPLNAQWAFDEPLIAKALQNVSVYFPHYSRHDESHSRQILVHIERLLGEENISKLTATDTWLLLEAAYLHDIGMIVSDDQLNKDFEAIKKHVEKTRHLANGETLIIMDALLASKTNTASAVFATVDFSPLHTVKLLREIIADFYRSKHPERANTITSNPMEIGLNSPRTELIPARLFGLLGKICAYHGSSFEQVMQLPKQQVGIGTDDCHPRFIACLLRLGDLLDLDDNRFCPVMMKMAGELPETSKAHYDKHLAIRHFRADPERIEIEADCPSYESYIETTQWFGWLRDEVKNQMSRWFDIVPARNFGLLPSVGDLKAHLKDWQVFSENQRPQFNLDRDRVFELLQGAGLYDSKEQAMRELLQNAVDATLIRIWREQGEDCTPKIKPFIKRDSAPRSSEVLDILSRYAIDVSITKEKEEEQFNYWRVSITDQGTGISRDDLNFMMQMGSSKKNHQRRAVIEKMPIWMKPSGIFGIGLHSVFLLTDEVIIETRSIDTGETLIIRLTNPTNAKERGNVYFQVITEPRTIELDSAYEKEKNRTVKPWDFSRYGCQLSFIYKTDKWAYPDRQSGDAVDQAWKNYDGLIDTTGDFYIIKLIGTIFDFFDYCNLAGNLKFIEDTLRIKKHDLLEKPLYYYAVNERLELINLSTLSSRLQFLYRGQEIKKSFFGFHLFMVTVNLLDEEADKILTINRNQFKDGDKIRETLFNRVKNAVQEFFKEESGENFYKAQSEEFQAIIAAEYESQGWNKPTYFITWHKLLIETRQGIKKIEELTDYDTIFCFNTIFTGYNRELSNSFLKINLTDPTTHLALDRRGENYGLVHEFLKANGFKSSYLKNELGIVKLSKHEVEPITEDMILEYCKKNLVQNKESLLENSFLKRQTIPCLKNYISLALKNPNVIPILGEEDREDWVSQNFDLDLISPRMLFPLARINDKITVGDLDILTQRVYKNRANQSVTEQQIKEKYQDFIAFLDDLMKDDAEWKKLRGDEFKLVEKNPITNTPAVTD